MDKYQKPIALAILMLIFSTWFLHNTKSDFPLIFKKDLLAHDESSNSVVAANITRKFFPPMVRTNPLEDQPGNWMEGPYWQHIPPLFAYAPYLFFQLDGQVTIEAKRLAYAFVILLTGLLFIFVVHGFSKNLWAASTATLASLLWINTPFTRELITGYAFGVSDIVLAFTTVCGFGAVLWYLREEREVRVNYPGWQLAVGSLLVALPIMAKNLLGAIPAATFFGLLIYDLLARADLPALPAWQAGKSARYKELGIAILAFLASLAIYYLPLYFASPQTFKSEVFVAFSHFSRLEGWARPWHFYITNYLPQRYLFDWNWVFWLGLVLGIGLRISDLRLKLLDHKEIILLNLSLGWFVWNLTVISLVTSKVPNFIFQSYLFSLFFIIFSFLALIKNYHFFDRSSLDTAIRSRNALLIVVLIISILITGTEIMRFVNQFKFQRARAYNYQSEHEKFYGTAELMSGLGLTSKDLTIVRVSDSDCWFRYYILFLTGAESKTLLEMNFGFDAGAIKQKYEHLYLVVNNEDSVPAFENPGLRLDLPDYSLVKFDLNSLDADQIENIVQSFVDFRKDEIEKDITRIKKDKTSCQWLVPDPILNAP